MPVFAQREDRAQNSHSVSPARQDHMKSRHGPVGNLFGNPPPGWGNQALQRLLRNRTIQAKLKINEPGDKYEQEADRVAEQIMHIPDSAVKGAASSGAVENNTHARAIHSPASIQRRCSECVIEKKKLQQMPLSNSLVPPRISVLHEPVRAKFSLPKQTVPIQRNTAEEVEPLQVETTTANVSPDAPSDLGAGIPSLRGGGQPLPPAVRTFMEPRFGHDFSKVRVHTDAQAAKSAQAVNARAFTVGNDIVFGTEQYAPNKKEGQWLIAHELAHTMQRTGSTMHRQENGLNNDTKPHITLTELGFTGDHAITSVTGGLGGSKGEKIDDPDGSEPVWNTSRDVSFPVAYTAGTAPAMFARFKVSPTTSQPIQVQIRAMIGNTIVGTAGGLTLTGDMIENTGAGTGMVEKIGGGAAIPGTSTVGVSNRRIEFQVYTNDEAIWWHAGSAMIRFVFTVNTPNPPGGDLREDALLESAAAAAAANQPEEGVRGLVANKLQYGGPPPLLKPSLVDDRVMDFFNDPMQYCEEHAFLMRYLVLTLGIMAKVKYFWMGTTSSVWLYGRPDPHPMAFPWEKIWSNFQCDRPAVDSMPANPTFNFHAMTEVGGILHDPAYDLIGLPGILKHAPGATSQLDDSESFWTAWENAKKI